VVGRAADLLTADPAEAATTQVGFAGPTTGTERVLAEVLAEVVRVEQVSVDSHFFEDLGADSMVMAQFCARVRKRPELPAVSIKDVYQHPTIRSLAASLADTTPTQVESPALAATEVSTPVSTPQYVLCGTLQLLFFLAYSCLAMVVTVEGYRWVSASSGVVDGYLRSAAFGGALFLGTCTFPIVAKWLLVGRWKPQQIRIWSLAYVRFWVVKALVQANPLVLFFLGSPLYVLYLRALGANIGRGVVIFSTHVPICTDLLTIGDGTVIRKDVFFNCYRAHAGLIQTGAVTLGKDVLVSEATVLDIETSLGDGAQLGHASSLHAGQAVPAGERWHGSPAQRSEVDYRLVDPTDCGTWRRVVYSSLQLLRVLAVTLPVAVGSVAVLLTVVPWIAALDIGPPAFTSWRFYRDALATSFVLYFGLGLLMLLQIATVPRVLNLLIKPDKVYPLYGFHFAVHRTISRMTNNRFLTALFGDSSYIVPYLRWVGYRLTPVVQTGSNFGTQVKHESPYLVAVGRGTVCASELSIITADFSSTSFRLSRAAIGANNFTGNLIAYPSQSRTGDNCLLATKVMVPIDGEVREGVGLLGSPSFEIPRTVQRDAKFVDLASGDELRRRLAAKNRHNLVTIGLHLLSRWFHAFVLTVILTSVVNLQHLVGTLAIAPVPPVVILPFTIFYSLLMERAATGFRRLRPTYCSIYQLDFWRVERFFKNTAEAHIVLSGTPFKRVILRLLGVRVGRRLYDDGCGFAEKNMVTIGDDVTLNAGSNIQCHSQEDYAFKSDYITIGSGCTIGVGALVHYGATMGDGAVLAPDSFLMKGEEVPPHTRWGGNPARELRNAAPVDRAASPERPPSKARSRPGRAPTVAETPAYRVGVSPSIYLQRDPDPPYVPREVDELLDHALDQRRFVLVVGSSKAGKSRSAFEAVRRRLPASPLVVPAGTSTSLAELVGDAPAGTDPGPPVLWLDDLDRYLGDASGFDHELLGRLRRQDDRLVIVATIDLTRWDDLRGTKGEIGWVARRILEHATEIQVLSRLSAAERAQAERLYPEVDLDRGLGEPLAACPALEWRYRLGQVVAPVGWAIVQAAVDWRRTGTTRPMAERELQQLCRRYLEAAHLDPPADRRGYAEGLAWACQPVAPGIALLQPADGRRSRRFVASDHLVALADHKAGDLEREVGAAAWELAVATATPEDAVRVGFSAYTRGNHEVAAAAWSRASASGHAEAAPVAAMNLGVLRERLGDADGAAAAFEQASTSGHPYAAPWAGVRLGLLRKRLGDAEGAAAAFEQAGASGHPDAAPLASLNLRLLANQPGGGQGVPEDATAVVMLLAQGDVEGARRACERVIASGHPDEAPRAAVDLGALLAVQGDIEGARLAFEFAADSGHPEHAPWAVIGLGLLLTRLGDPAYARRAYQNVVRSGHPQAAVVAASNLETLEEQVWSLATVSGGKT
jgi:non-ribosomal peptide synthetase-like protein